MTALVRTKSLKNAKNCQTQRKIVRECEFNANAHQKSLRTAPWAAPLHDRSVGGTIVPRTVAPLWGSCASAHREAVAPWRHCANSSAGSAIAPPRGVQPRPAASDLTDLPYCTPPCVPPCAPPASSRTCALERSSRSAAITIARASSSGFARSFLLGRFAKMRVSSFISALI